MQKNVDTTFSSAVCAELAKSGPYSAHLRDEVMSGNLLGVINFKVPFTGITLSDYRSATQIQALFKKNLDIDFGLDPLRAAWKAFIDAELHCRTVNEYFGLTPPFPVISQVLTLARGKIKRVLGPVPPLSRLRPRFGPGASTTIKRSKACPEYKLMSTLVCSNEMYPVVDSFLKETPEWVKQHSEGYSCGRRRAAEGETPTAGDPTELDRYTTLEWCGVKVPLVIDVGTLSFVEKNAKTHRPIVVEPLLNGFWQLGVGDYIKERLCIHANQNLRDQQRNRDLARRGSLDGSLATIDLSSASDTIAFSVVFDLLPEPWVDLLSTLRTGVIYYDGIKLELEKFSSMGNGFTFELESLLFWAPASACTELRCGDQNDVSVYGDDIIVPTDVVDLLHICLHYCGFTVNTDKSYSDGPFRESCGADWLNGDDVRPIFKKDRLTIQWLFLFHNWSMRRGEIALANIAKSFIPEDFQITGPDGFGDGHLLGSYELKKPRYSKRRGWEGGYFSTFREVHKTVETDSNGNFLYGLYDLYSRGPTNWWEPRSLRDPGTVPGSKCVEKTSIYTFSEFIFAR
jgi:hypothetical protein